MVSTLKTCGNPLKYSVKNIVNEYLGQDMTETPPPLPVLETFELLKLCELTYNIKKL